MESTRMSSRKRQGQLASLLILLMCASSCAHSNTCGVSSCDPAGCGPATAGCGKIKGCGGVGCGKVGCGDCCQICEKCSFALCGWMWRKPNAVPETLPLGSTLRAHDQVMQTNAEAADFIFHRHDFVGQTAHLTSDAKDKIVEVAARYRSTPFPVIIERSENNSNPELDALRRNIVATILTDFGNEDAQQRTVVATPYGPGYTGRRAEMMYYQHVGFGGNNNTNGTGNNGMNTNNFGGGFGGSF